ncbi:tRNA pseudouridine(38-40) synthase TruA [Myxococcota bacterium]|nr:tRNA pseudouridine(38-40) synthase TruA [Myxococcota bacterium]
MPDLKLTLEYDGQDFAGWQSQARAAGARTVQETLQDAIAQVTGEETVVQGSGRTDAGVHAEGQVASVHLDSSLAPEVLQRALCAVLPSDLAVTDIEVAPRGFHARYDALSKHYRYQIWNAVSRSPLRRYRHHCVARPLDVEAMGKAAIAIVGRRDFASFEATGSERQSSVREVTRCDVTGHSGDEIRIDLEADGLLRYMVRNIAGTLIEVGGGQRAPESLPHLLEARNRALAGPTAPALGLTLVSVTYADSASNPRC